MPDPIGGIGPNPRFVPTFGPERTISGPLPKNFGARVWIPYRTEVTLQYDVFEYSLFSK